MTLNDLARRVRAAVVDEHDLVIRGKQRGRLRIVVTDDDRQMVRMMRANGDSIETICRAMRVAPVSLQRYYGDELKTAFNDLKALMGARVVQLAMAGNINALKYWLSTHCPEWRIPKDLSETEKLMNDNTFEERVHFYMPDNGRDKPEEDEPPTIDAEVA